MLFELVKKRMKGNMVNREKVMRYFLYRGYSYDEIKNCINNINFED
ncbi:MAG: RecX family transcriptional regulator [Clostridia bacterium]|nr:RecX family transcriptional regulator [Clostridia bacterium]